MLARPFTDWPAYNMGLIDAKGKKIKNASTSEEKDQFSRFMNIIRNIKRVINKMSGQTETKLTNLMVGAALIKEELALDASIKDPEYVTNAFLEEIRATYFGPNSLTESLDLDEQIEPGRYKLISEFYESEPVFYINESISPNVRSDWNLYHIEDVLGRMYFATKSELTRI